MVRATCFLTHLLVSLQNCVTHSEPLLRVFSTDKANTGARLNLSIVSRGRGIVTRGIFYITIITRKLTKSDENHLSLEIFRLRPQGLELTMPADLVSANAS
jgi:hypothetical protein